MATEIATPIVASKEEAKERGLKFYFSRPCKYGHASVRYTKTGNCIACIQDDKNKELANRRHKQRYEKKKLERPPRKPTPRIQAKASGLKRYFTGKPCKHGHVGERLVSTGSCQECHLSHARMWGAENREAKKTAQRKSHLKLRLVRNEESRQWRSRNPEKKAGYGRARRARLQGSSGSHTPEDLRSIFRAQRGKCAICRVKLGKKQHVDHIVALSRGGSNDRRNIQILCAFCNISKHNSDQIDYMRQRLGRLL